MVERLDAAFYAQPIQRTRKSRTLRTGRRGGRQRAGVSHRQLETRDARRFQNDPLPARVDIELAAHQVQLRLGRGRPDADIRRGCADARARASRFA